MAAHGAFRITDPDKVNMTLTITMSVKEWKVIRQRLQPETTDGEWYLNDTIIKLIDKADQAFSFYDEVQ